jgi:hypothetical protein
MIQPTNLIVSQDLIKKMAEFDADGLRVVINEPTGDFFYDPWHIKSEFVGTPFEQALDLFPDNIGEARIIILESGRCYFSHSDVDDRYHLNLSGDCAALMNLETGSSYFLKPDGIWYDMDAGLRHSAVNFGQYNRKQLVVRKLLTRNTLKSPVDFYIKAQGTNARFVFDNAVGPWLNRANKFGIITDFETNLSKVYFKIEEQHIKELNSVIPPGFEFGDIQTEIL